MTFGDLEQFLRVHAVQLRSQWTAGQWVVRIVHNKGGRTAAIGRGDKLDVTIQAAISSYRRGS